MFKNPLSSEAKRSVVNIATNELVKLPGGSKKDEDEIEEEGEGNV